MSEMDQMLECMIAAGVPLERRPAMQMAEVAGANTALSQQSEVHIQTPFLAEAEASSAEADRRTFGGHGIALRAGNFMG